MEHFEELESVSKLIQSNAPVENFNSLENCTMIIKEDTFNDSTIKTEKSTENNSCNFADTSVCTKSSEDDNLSERLPGSYVSDRLTNEFNKSTTPYDTSEDDNLSSESEPSCEIYVSDNLTSVSTTPYYPSEDDNLSSKSELSCESCVSDNLTNEFNESTTSYKDYAFKIQLEKPREHNISNNLTSECIENITLLDDKLKTETLFRDYYYSREKSQEDSILKVETSQEDNMLKAETSQEDNMLKTETSQEDNMLKTESSQEDSLKAGTSQEDSLKAETSQEDSLKAETSQEYSLKAGTSQEDSILKAESSQQDSILKAESSQQDSLRVETSQRDSLRVETSQDSLRAGSSQEDSLRAGSSQEDSLRAGSSQEDSLRARSSQKDSISKVETSQEDSILKVETSQEDSILKVETSQEDSEKLSEENNNFKNNTLTSNRSTGDNKFSLSIHNNSFPEYTNEPLEKKSFKWPKNQLRYSEKEKLYGQIFSMDYVFGLLCLSFKDGTPYECTLTNLNQYVILTCNRNNKWLHNLESYVQALGITHLYVAGTFQRDLIKNFIHSANIVTFNKENEPPRGGRCPECLRHGCSAFKATRFMRYNFKLQNCIIPCPLF